MEETTVFINFETLDLARIYLFGGVKYLDLLLVLSIIDVITGVIKAWKFKKQEPERLVRLRSEDAQLFGGYCGKHY